MHMWLPLRRIFPILTLPVLGSLVGLVCCCTASDAGGSHFRHLFEHHVCCRQHWARDWRCVYILT
jgi:hypothetical protein